MMEIGPIVIAVDKAISSILPAIAGSIGGAVFVIIPQSKFGWVITLTVGVGCGVYLSGIPLSIYPALGHSGSMMVAAWLGVITLRTAGFAIQKMKVEQLADIILKRKPGE